ncbi:MAG: hypothetical protein ACTSXP_07725 [Promethearchaeota archaeon]
MSWTEEEIKEICAKPVKILPSAYQKMLMHVLRFGSSGVPKDQWRECYGMCIGKFKNKTVWVTDALPTTHGSDIGVEFVEENYILMAQFLDQLDKQNAEIEDPGEKLFIVGWYHSHPGMERFLSSVDVRNQLAYQTSNFPFGIAIVFDNTALFQKDAVTGELDFGFKIFRLDDPTSTEVNIPFSEVPFDRSLLDKPDIIDMLKNMINMIENVQKQAPIIKEYKEAPSIFGIFKIPTTEDLKKAGSGITTEERQSINVLPLEDLDLVFTKAMQLFIKKYENLNESDKSNLMKFVDDGLVPAMDGLLKAVVGGLNEWGTKLRIDIDRRVNFGVSALNTIKSILQSVQDDYLKFLKDTAEKNQELMKDAVKKLDQAEINFKKLLRKYEEKYKTIFESMKLAWKNLVDEAKQKISQPDILALQESMERLLKAKDASDSTTHETEKDTKLESVVKEFENLLSEHLQKVNDITQALENKKAVDKPPDLLRDFKIPSTGEITDMEPFIDNSEEFVKDFLKIQDISENLRTGLKEFVEFYDELPPDKKDDMRIINEEGIQPLSDKIITNLVRGLNRWTIGLRDDVDRRINLLVSIANEMVRTMKTIQKDYVDFLATSGDPVARMQFSLEKILHDVETNAISVLNGMLNYMGQIMENITYVYQSNLESQQKFLESKDFKKLLKLVEQVKKSTK